MTTRPDCVFWSVWLDVRGVGRISNSPQLDTRNADVGGGSRSLYHPLLLHQKPPFLKETRYDVCCYESAIVSWINVQNHEIGKQRAGRRFGFGLPHTRESIFILATAGDSAGLCVCLTGLGIEALALGRCDFIDEAITNSQTKQNNITHHVMCKIKASRSDESITDSPNENKKHTKTRWYRSRSLILHSSYKYM